MKNFYTYCLGRSLLRTLDNCDWLYALQEYQASMTTNQIDFYKMALEVMKIALNIETFFEIFGKS